MGKIINLDTRSEFRKAVDGIEFDLETNIKFIELKSKLVATQYKSLIKNGFTKEQALQIIIENPAWGN